MKPPAIFTALLILGFSIAAAQETQSPPADAATSRADASYGLGYRTGLQFRHDYGNFGLTLGDLDPESFLDGFLSAFKGDEPVVTEDRFAAANQALGDLIQQREEELAARNLREGEAFLAEISKNEGIQKLDGGVLYEVLKKGGKETYMAPKEGEPGKQFLAHYTGMLIDGTRFDSSPSGEPMPMTLEDHPMSVRVIPGIEKALARMPIGAKWKLYIPSKLAYGEKRRSAEVGPNATLIFELELIAIEDVPAPPIDLPPGLPSARDNQ